MRVNRDESERPASAALRGRARKVAAVCLSPDQISQTLSRLPTQYLLALAALVVSVLAYVCDERVPVNGGLGWDGVQYARWAKDFHEEVCVTGVSTYYIQRILPAALVHYSLRFLHVPLTDPNIMRAFAWQSVLLLTLAGYVWGLIARELHISPAGKWLGFAAFFLNYVVLKHTFYVPVTTDVAAFVIGPSMLYFYLTGKTRSLYLLTLVGAFVWPLSMYVGALLLLFPRQGQEDTASAPVRGRLNVATAALVTLVAFFGIRYVLRKGPVLYERVIDPAYVEPIRSVVYLSLGIALLYLFSGLSFLLQCPRLFDWRFYARSLRAKAWIVVPALFALVKYLQFTWSNKQPFFSIQEMLALTAVTSVAKPGVFLVTHIAYYGPVFILALFMWKPICRLLHEHGSGLPLVIALGLLLSLNNQSRYFINIMSLLIPFIVKATDSLAWRPAQYGLFAGLCVLCSKVWLTINCGPFQGTLLEFPDQYMFMSHGPWISNSMYLAQGGAFLAVGWFLYASSRKREAGQNTVRLFVPARPAA